MRRRLALLVAATTSVVLLAFTAAARRPDRPRRDERGHRVRDRPQPADRADCRRRVDDRDQLARSPRCPTTATSCASGCRRAPSSGGRSHQRPSRRPRRCGRTAVRGARRRPGDPRPAGRPRGRYGSDQHPDQRGRPGRRGVAVLGDPRRAGGDAVRAVACRRRPAGPLDDPAGDRARRDRRTAGPRRPRRPGSSPAVRTRCARSAARSTGWRPGSASCSPHEREAVADLSHRLRTPVTALRLDVESLPHGPDRDRLTADVDEMTRQIDVLIREARRPVREGVEARSDACAIVRERVEFWQALAEDQGRRVGLSLPDRPCQVRAGAADLEAALDALLGNVIAHTPEGTAMDVDRDDTGSGRSRRDGVRRRSRHLRLDGAGARVEPRQARPGSAWTSPVAPRRRPAAS